ncbi:MAG: hypothetical protein ABFC62_05015 [Clostridiaceae bacterium]|nr:DUF370 domain-containing protein [Eubacteriales bacterium]
MSSLHVGAETVLDINDIIAVIPRETALASRDTRRALDDAIGGTRVVSVSDEPQKSYLICLKNERLCVYSSPIASTTLQKRAAEDPFSADRAALNDKTP